MVELWCCYRYAMQQPSQSPTPVPPAKRARHHRAGVAARLDEIRAELRRLAATIEAERAAILDCLAEAERQQGRRQ